MGVTEDSVKNYMRALMKKFACETRVQLALTLLHGKPDCGCEHLVLASL